MTAHDAEPRVWGAFTLWQPSLRRASNARPASQSAPPRPPPLPRIVPSHQPDLVTSNVTEIGAAFGSARHQRRPSPTPHPAHVRTGPVPPVAPDSRRLPTLIRQTTMDVWCSLRQGSLCCGQSTKSRNSEGVSVFPRPPRYCLFFILPRVTDDDTVEGLVLCEPSCLPPVRSPRWGGGLSSSGGLRSRAGMW